MSEFKEIEHLLIKKIEGLEVGSESVTFRMGNGRTFVMKHTQDCYESVSVNEIVGNIPESWDGAYVVRAEESSEDGGDRDSGTSTWTFYRLDTSKGCIVIRWLGSSNGYYSERVDFSEICHDYPNR